MIFIRNLMKMMSFCDASSGKSRPHADRFQWNLDRSKLVDRSQRSEKMVCRRFNWPMKVGVQSGLCYCGFLEPWFWPSGCEGECFAPYLAALDWENEKDSALDFHCAPAQGNCGKWCQRCVTGDVKSPFFVIWDSRRFEEFWKVDEPRGISRSSQKWSWSDPTMISRIFKNQDFPSKIAWF